MGRRKAAAGKRTLYEKQNQSVAEGQLKADTAWRTAGMPGIQAR
jgi:hypothetical protein